LPVQGFAKAHGVKPGGSRIACAQHHGEGPVALGS